MPNPLKAGTPLVLDDGREFSLTMGHAVLFDAEQASSIPLPRLMAQAKLGFVGATRAFLFAAIRPHHPDITIEEVSEITLSNLESVDAALKIAMEVAFPEAAEGKEGKNPPPTNARTGKGSGASGAKPGSTRKHSGKKRRAPTK